MCSLSICWGRGVDIGRTPDDGHWSRLQKWSGSLCSAGKKKVALCTSLSRALQHCSTETVPHSRDCTPPPQTKPNKLSKCFTTPVRISSGACLLLGILCIVGLAGELLLWSCDQETFELS